MDAYPDNPLPAIHYLLRNSPFLLGRLRAAQVGDGSVEDGGSSSDNGEPSAEELPKTDAVSRIESDL